MSEEKKERPSPLVRAVDRLATPEESMSHPLNPNSLVSGWSLSDRVGLKRTALHHLRIPAGKESFVYHSHQTEEEFMYVLSGRGIVELDGVEHELGPGDFLGFPAPSVAHHLRNPFSEDLVYLSGGERREVEIADFPRLGKRMVRVGPDVTLYPAESATGLDGSKKK